MEQLPSNQNDSYKELTELSGSELREPAVDAIAENRPVEASVEPEVVDKSNNKLKKVLRDIGGIAVVSAMTYGALKSGQLDHVPVMSGMVEKGEIGMGMGSLSIGLLASKSVDLVNTFRKK